MDFAKMAQLLPVVAMAVGAVERFRTDIKGADKKQAALDMIRDALPAVEILVGRDLVDNAAFLDGIGDMIDGYVKTRNAVN